MNTIQAVVVTPNAPGRLALGAIDRPSPAPSEALVRVAAFSLNRGEVRGAQGAPSGNRIGWDLAGTVDQAAADGSGPAAGTRVVGWLPTGAWAELAAVPTHALAALPESVTFEQAATLPIAGLTALRALEKRGALLQRRVLITGASGGVGDLAVQLARDAGARVVGQLRSEARAARVRDAGAHDVVVGADAAGAAAHGPYDLVVDGVGGAVLASTLALLAPDGLAVAYGATIDSMLTFDLRPFFLAGGLSLYGFIIFHELRRQPAHEDLGRLAALVAAGRLRPHITVEASWSEIGAVAQRLLERDFPGKAVLRVD
jgi:NADPH:quinone reductase-like Zn-dependent oxidoreductase